MELNHKDSSGKAGKFSEHTQGQPTLPPSEAPARQLNTANNESTGAASARAPMRMTRSHPGRSISDSRG